jgi:hypothetical protein
MIVYIMKKICCIKYFYQWKDFKLKNKWGSDETNKLKELKEELKNKD